MDDEVRRATESEGAGNDTGQDADSPVDWDAALDVTGGDVDLLVEVLDALQIEMPQMLASLYEALESGDVKLLNRAAHTLKNGCQNVGARAAEKVAFDLEMITKSGGDNQRVRPLIDELATHLEQVQQEVARFLLSRRDG